MSARILSKAFRDAYDSAQYGLTDARGLLGALDATLEAYPSLMTDDTRNASIWALMRAIDGQIAATDAAFCDVWQAAKGEAIEIE